MSAVSYGHTHDTRPETRPAPDTHCKTRAAGCCAAASYRSVSEFVLENALARADGALAERPSFALTAAEWKALIAALDAHPRPLPQLKRLLNEPGFFDAGPNQ